MAALRATSEQLVPFVEWQQQYSDSDRRKQIIAIEKAAMSSKICLEHMKATLAAESEKGLARICQLWKDRIEEVIALPKSHEVLVGVRGVTGSGKSTLINALLRMKDLLPTNSSQACTAVPVEVAYNYVDDDRGPFLAEVQFATRDEWKEELDDLFRDVGVYFLSKNDPEMDEDPDLKDRITDALCKLKYVYPYLKSIHDLRDKSTAELLDDKNVKGVLNSNRKIRKSTQSQFSAAIMMYIATQESDRKKFAHWPLITRVKLFVKAEILKSGLVLVDLPGGMDSNTARRTVAERYQKRLAVTCVVADVRRGRDDKNAHELIDELLKRDLQMDGMYDADRLCFVLSQCDRDYDITNYLKQNRALEVRLAPELQKLRVMDGKAMERKSQCQTTRQSCDENISKVQRFEDEIKKLRSKYDLKTPKDNLKRKRGQDNGSATRPSPYTPAQKLAAETSVAELEKLLYGSQEAVNAAAKEYSDLIKRVDDLTKARTYAYSKVVQECNKHKFAKSIAAIQRDFECTRMDMGRTSTKPLPVFCVSATTYLSYLTRSGQIKFGFATSSDTQIPSLRDWLFRFTYAGREDVARSIIDCTELLVATIKPWIDDRRGDVKLSDIDRAQLESMLRQEVKELDQKFSDLCVDITTSVAKLVDTKIYSKMPNIERQAAIESKNTIIKFGKEHHWNTYRAVNLRHGQWTMVTKRKEITKKDHRWNDRLFHDYTNHLVRDWNEVFFSNENGLPQIINMYIRKAEQLFEDFISAATSIEDNLDLSMKLELKDLLTKIGNLLQSKAKDNLGNIKLAVRESHRDVAAPAIREYLTPLYDQCGAEKGRHHFARSKAAHQTNIMEKGAVMHRTASTAIKNALDGLLNEFGSKISESHHEIIEQMQNLIELFLEEKTSTNSKYPTRRILSRPKADLQNSLRQDIVGLDQAWKEEVCFAPDEQDDLDGLEHEQDDKYGINKADDSDGEYVDEGSDEEEL